MKLWMDTSLGANIGIPGLVAIADYFGVSLDYLMGRTDVREINRGQP